MAINPETQYPGKIAPSDADYPFGGARNITLPGDGTGTPWEAALTNDIFGFQQALLSRASIVPSGSPETAILSQYIKALIASHGAVYGTKAALIADTELVAGAFVETGGYYDGWAALAKPAGGGKYATATLQQVRDARAEPAWVPNEQWDFTLVSGDVAVLLSPDGGINGLSAGLIDDWDFETQAGTDNTPFYQVLIDAAQAGEFNHITLPACRNRAMYFAPVATKTTCVFLGVDAVDWQTNPLPIVIDGDATIAVDNDGANNVWMSGPDDSTGSIPVNVVNDVNIEGNLTITSSHLTAANRAAFDDPNTTLANFGIGFNISRWWRSAFTFNNEFAKGLVQAPSADGLYDSTNTFIQQVDILNCQSTHAQENFIEATQGFSVNVIGGKIERGNGGIDMQRSNGQAFFRTKISGVTIQANGKDRPIKINFGTGFEFSSNYMESNRISGVPTEQVRMSPNDVQSLNSMVFEGNFFSQQVAGLDAFGAPYNHVELDGFGNFFPKGNDFTGGNGYRITNGGERSGVHDGAADAAALTDTTANFQVDAYIGATIQNITDGSTGTVTANTATVITATLAGGTDNDWDVDDEYHIINAQNVGKIYSEGETYTPVGSTFSEGDVAIGDMDGVRVTGKVYSDPVDEVPRVNASKRATGNELGFSNMEAISIPDGTAHTFRKSARGVFALSARFTALTQTIFSAADAGAAPLVMAEPAGALFDYSATPSVPAAGRIDVAVNATSDGITVYNNLGSDRDFVLHTIAAVDWA